MEAAVNDAAKEFNLDERTIYKAWRELLERDRFAKALNETLAKKRDSGATPQEVAELWATSMATYVKEAKLRLKRKG